jgi:hypothetical protein
VLLKAFTWLGALGAAALGAVLLLGFEEDRSGLLVASLLLMAIGPVAVFAHLLATPALTWAEKRAWLPELLGPRMSWAFAAYIQSRDRAALARKIARRRRALASRGGSRPAEARRPSPS